jgi:ribonuclease P protein component
LPGEPNFGSSRTSRARGRLTRSAEFERVYRQGKSNSDRFLVLYAFASGEGERPRLGLSVPRKVGGATERNLVKRLLREAFAAQEEALQGELDIVIVARPAALELAEREGLEGIARSVHGLLASAKVIDTDVDAAA